MILESREVTKKHGSKTAFVNRGIFTIGARPVYAMLGPQWKRQDHLDENGSRTCKAY